jgi:hypothetical protein
MAEDLFINVDNDLRPHEDYNFLRAEGIRLIERLSGKVWTNYNSHDPGITLLEALCYTLTDLGYRTSFEVRDILAPDSQDPDWGTIFYTSRQILPSNPVTLTDFRKLIIDTEGIKNAWIEVSNEYEVLLYLNAKDKAVETDPATYQLDYSSSSDNEPMRLRGLYKITVDYDEDIITGNKQAIVDENVRKKLNVHRNLCEDFLSIKPVNYEYFTMEAEIQIWEGFDIEQVNAKIFQVIHNFFSPSIRFYTLEQMMERGYTAEEIFEGPALKNGFIDTVDLEKSERYMDIHLSDIIKLISDIPGVIAVKKCVFPIETQSAFSDFTQWITNIKEKEKAPKLDLEKSTIRFVRSGDRHRTDKEKTPDKKRVQDIFNFLQSGTRSSKIKGLITDSPVPRGDFMNIAEYYPFQYSLPSSYGMQENITGQSLDYSIIEPAIDELKAKGKNPGTRISTNTETLDSAAFDIFGKSLTALQSIEEFNRVEENFITVQVNKYGKKGRQILQLRGFLIFFEQIMADYLSQLSNISHLFSFEPTVSQTFYPQVLQNIYDLGVLIINAKIYRQNNLKLIETEKQFLKKRSDILDHLMARYGENAETYAPRAFQSNQTVPSATIKNKVNVLADYVAISNYRGNGFDYSSPDRTWDTDNVTGMKRRICRLLGMENFNTNFLTTDWISVEEVVHPNNLVRKKVVLREPGKPENILLESSEFDSDSEIREVLQYILQNGFKRSLFDVDATPNKFAYRLKRKNQEDVFENVAGKDQKSNDDLTNNLKKLIETIDQYAHVENFHILEHVLLRPKVNPQDTGRAAAAVGPQLQATSLLTITNVPDADFFAGQRRPFIAYKFKVTTVSDPNVKDKTTWKLSLQKDKADVIVVNDDFIFESHVRTRMEHIREIATDIANFKIEQDLVKDNRFVFSIVDWSKKPAQVLAVGAKSYQKKEDLDEDVKALIKFFSFDVGFLDDDSSDKIDFTSFADPYSFRISLFIPKWPVKFNDPGFRHLFEKAVYLETPAHIYQDVYWLDYKEMKEFEAVYKPWLREISSNQIPDSAIVNNLIGKLNELRKFSGDA